MRAALQDRPYRTVAKAAKISAAYISDMVQGRIPKREIVISFAEATGADVNELLRLAGYAPLAEGPSASPTEALESLIESADELTYDPDLEDVTIKGFKGAENLTPEQIELANRVVRALLTEQRRKRGVE